MPTFKSGKRDLLIILVLLVVALLFWVANSFFNKTNQSGGKHAELIYNDEVVEIVNLDKDRHFSIDELPNVEFEIKDGKIAFVKSDCPDQICVKSGWMDSNGHFAACLPNNILVWVVDQESENSEGTDAVSQ